MHIEIHAADTIGKLSLRLTIPTWLKFSFSLTAWKSSPMADMKNGSTWSFAMHSAHIRQTMKTSLWLNLYNIPAILRATPPKLVLIWPGLVPSAYVTKMTGQLQGRKTLYIVLTIIFFLVILATKSMMAPPITTYSNTLLIKNRPHFVVLKTRWTLYWSVFNAICWMFYKDILCTLVLQVLSD